MSAFLFDIVEEMMNYSRTEDQATLYDSLYNAESGLLPEAKQNLLAWIDEVLNMCEIPAGKFRDAFLRGYEYDQSDCRTELLAHIKECCDPEARATDDE